MQLGLKAKQAWTIVLNEEPHRRQLRLLPFIPNIHLELFSNIHAEVPGTKQVLEECGEVCGKILAF